MNIGLFLADYRWGRVALHLCLACRMPRRMGMHLEGIRREFSSRAPKPPRKNFLLFP
ncbi:MAG: hypothetical protein PHV34_08450 [Verrucomicrobiae bacterium]|nr:hypothetical protein [Verrucomicrobiae bacterium]